MNLFKSMLLAVLSVGLFLNSGCLAAGTKNVAAHAPSDLVIKILADAKPIKQPPCWKVMTSARLEYLSPFLAPSLESAIKEWMKSRDKLDELGPYPDGAYDPLTYQKWQPETVIVGKTKYSGGTAIVTVEETLKPSKINSGYHGTSCYIFSFQAGQWKLGNIVFSRVYIATKGELKITLRQELQTTSKQMRELYNFQRKL